MRIGIDCRLPYYRTGGISKYILSLIRALALIDHQDDFTIFQSRKELKEYLPTDLDNFTRAKLWTPCHHKVERWTLSVELRWHNLDVLHSPDFIPPQFGARKRIITVHDLNFIYFPEFLTQDSRRYYNQINWAADQADHIIADSNHTRQDLIDRCDVGKEKITTIYLAPDPIFYRKTESREPATTLTKYNLPNGFLLSVGTLSPRKNIPTLLAAYTRLIHEESFDLPLVLVGARGWLYDDIFESVNQLGIAKAVRFIETANDEELINLYKSASLLVMPSYYEGFGLPLLEAMQCGCPVISSDRGSLPEIAGGSALHVSPDDVDGWSQAILQVINDQALRSRLIASGYLRADQFSWQRTAEQTLQVYRSIG